MISLIGALPPPIGGVTTHILQLSSALAGRGFQCEVVDTVGTRAVTIPSGVSVQVLSGNPFTRVVRLALHLRRSSAPVRHFHISQGSTFFRISPLLLSMNTARVSTVCTIHSGAIDDFYGRLNVGEQRTFAWSMSRMDRVVAINEEIARFLVGTLGLPAAHVVESSSFLGLRIDGRGFGIPKAMSEIRRAASHVLITSGCRQPLYRYEDFIRAVELARDAYPQLHAVIIAYDKTEPSYWDSILQMVSARPYIHVLGPMPHEAFLSFLGTADLYVRCTESDSCGVAVHEALSVGTATVATDVCRRPPSVATVPCGRPDLLAMAIATCLRTSPADRSSTSESSGLDALIRMYQSLGEQPVISRPQ